MCGDLYHIDEEIRILESEQVDYLHIDIMDGHFVNNLGFGIDFIKNLRKHASIPFDFHLMVENPNKIIPMLDVQPHDIVSVHFESTYHIQETIDLIKKYRCLLFLALNPGTPVLILEMMYPYINGINFMTVHPGFFGQQIVQASFEKFKRLRQFMEKIPQKDLLMEADGNMNFENAKIFAGLGADIFVAGTSSIFPDHKLDPKAIRKYREIINAH